MTYKSEFPDYDAATMPSIPAGFVDVSWHNDAAPTFLAPLLGLVVWTDYASPQDREFPTSPRFGLVAESLTMDGQRAIEAGPVLLQSDDWRAVQVAMIVEAFARILQNALSYEHWQEMRLRNYGLGPFSIVCHSHDHIDANDIMAAAFALIMGRQPWTPCDADEGLCSGENVGEDSDVWNAAWDQAKARHLTGEDVDFAAPKVGAVVEFQNGILGIVERVFPAGFAVIYSPGYGEGGDDGDYIPARFEVIRHPDGDTEDSLTFVADDEAGLPDLEGAVEICEDLLSRTDGGDQPDDA